MKVGIVCPYSWDVPGGVQFHVRDLAEVLIARGHEVSVLAPADDDTPLPPYVVPAGRAVPVPLQRLGGAGELRPAVGGAGAAVAARRRVRRAARARAGHAVACPCWPAGPRPAPIVATFHTANLRSRAMLAAYPILRAGAGEDQRPHRGVRGRPGATLVEHLGGDAVVIPNGVVRRPVRRRRAAADGWPGAGGTVGFIGRFDEPRKGLPTLLAAHGRRRRRRARACGCWSRAAATPRRCSRTLPAGVRDAVTFLGLVSEDDKARLLRSVDVYVAPNLGGESFGIVLVEAMAAGAPVLASDLDAFRRVLDGGRVGRCSRPATPPRWPTHCCALLDDPAAARRRCASAAQQPGSRRFDWDDRRDRAARGLRDGRAAGPVASRERLGRGPGGTGCAA